MEITVVSRPGDDYGLPGGLEITERGFREEPAHAEKVLDRLAGTPLRCVTGCEAPLPSLRRVSL
jgi:hypothetical protein